MEYGSGPMKFEKNDKPAPGDDENANDRRSDDRTKLNGSGKKLAMMLLAVLMGVLGGREEEREQEGIATICSSSSSSNKKKNKSKTKRKNKNKRASFLFFLVYLRFL